MRKSPCKCPTGLQQICKHAKVTDCKDVAEIVEALTFEAESVRKSKRSRPPKFKTKPFKPRHFKDTCVPMVPSMHTRLRYIGHCDAEPPRPDRKAGCRRNFGEFEFESTSEEEETTSSILRTGKKREKFKKKVRYFDLLPGDILLPTPVPVIKHTASDKSILNVASPKTSGEVIPAQRTIVVPGEIKPPIPPKSAYELFKPHSGIIINRDKEFVPDVVHTPGSRKPRPQQKRKPCHKEICYRKTCTRKKCRKYAAMRKRQMTRKIKRSRFDVPYTTIGEPIDGKPRASTQKHIRDDDSICGLDEIPKPEHVRIPANLKRGILQTHSLTVLPCTKERKPEIHYGILTGSFNMYDAKFSGRSKGRQALTISVMAYCLAFHYHPKQWTMKLVDSLVDAGDQWYLQCLEKVHDHSAVQGICEVLPFGKKQTLILNGKRMQVLLGEPDIVGYAMSLDPTVYNLCRGLKAFFKGNRAGILLTRVLKVVIWKDRICYYVFDPAGRDSRAYSNFTNGCSALINVKDLVSVAEILLARSVLEDQKFVLAPVKVLKMVDEKCDEDFESDRELTQAEKAMIGYRILNENSAIVNANMHLGDKCFEDAKFRQALTVAIVAITYAKISPPNTWFSKTLDKILRLGNILFAECSHPKVMIDLTIDNIPNEIIVGPYACEIIIYRERVKGQLFTTKECLLNIKTGLEEFFSREDNSGILQFNNYSLAIWRQKDMFYLFDPYPRTNDGLRSFKTGKACCLMLLNPETMASAFTKNWDYLPVTTQFHIHAFKVLKLKKKEPKMQIVCTLSDDQLSGANARIKRKVLPLSQAQGDGGEIIHDILPANNFNTINIDNKQSGPQVDEEQMGDIISLVDSIQEDYLPLIPLRYKNMGSEPLQDKVVNLDSPTVSVTQVVPPWPKPRDKTNELPEPDPDPEPTPPPTPPQLPPPEDGEEEEEEVGEEEDEDTMKRKKEEEQRKKAEEEARRKAEELPSPLPPPPPSPQPEPEVPLAPIQMAEDEVQTIQPVNVDRRILLSEDAHYRFKLRQLRKKMTPPLIEDQLEGSPSEELLKPSNFKDLPDKTQIVRGSSAITDANVIDILPFAAIMAIVTSYKYSINTWTSGIVNFIVDTAKKLYSNKLEKFQMAPIHIIPKIGIGHQAYQANIDVVGEGATWQLEDALSRKFFLKYDRGMITTSNYSCAVFKRNGLYYLYDGSSCNAMGIRDEKNKGKACFLRFSTLHDLVSRILYNKDGRTEDQQFILSRILVRRLLAELRMKLPEDYDYITGLSKSKPSIVLTEKDSEKRSFIESAESKSQTIIGYQLVEGIYRIEGTTSLKDRKPSSDVKSCHFVSLIAMLMAAMHPIRTWDHIMVDTCIEKGLEINEKATNLNVCEKRVIKNIILDGKFININIKKITVVNENPDKRLEQYLKAVLRRLRYVVIRFLQCSMAICQTDGYFHLFDPYPPPSEETQPQISTKDDQNKKTENPVEPKKASDVATWTLYRSIDALTHRIRKVISGSSVESPEFYTFELTSVKPAPRHSALNYRLSPLFKPDDNPNLPYLKRRRVRPIVDEKMYWLNIESIPWSRMNCFNDLGFERKTPRTMWKDWDIEFPGDLYSLWGSVHPLDKKFDDNHRGKQYLAISVVAIVMTKACNLSAWTGSFLDGIVINGDKYHRKCLNKIGNHPNYEIAIMDLDTKFDEMFPYSFSVKFNKIIFGFVYNHFPDRFNLSKALVYFFEKNSLGILTSPTKNLAFGKCDTSYFMFDCQSYGVPIFSPDQGASYMLKCESLNRLIYCITLTLNIRRHSQQFHLFSVNVSLTEKGK